MKDKEVEGVSVQEQCKKTRRKEQEGDEEEKKKG